MTATILLTRPAAQSQRFAADLVARVGDVPVVISPIIEITLDTAAASDGLRNAGGLIFTSENGVAACNGLTIPPGLPAFCVGSRTAKAAQRLGCDVRTGPGDLERLIPLITAEGWPSENGPLVHLHGAHVTGDVCATLASRGITAKAVVVYDQAAHPLSPEALTLLAGRASVLMPIFSPRTAALLADNIVQATAPVGIAAISPAVARAVPMHSAQIVRIADSPDGKSMLDAIAALLRERKFS